MVFVSHARQQKAGVAQPLRESPYEVGFHSFLDVKNLRLWWETVGEQLEAATIYCNVVVFLFFLSTEFVMKKWPLTELREIMELKCRVEVGSVDLI